MLTVVRLNMKRIFKNKIYNPMAVSLLGWGPLGNVRAVQRENLTEVDKA